MGLFFIPERTLEKRLKVPANAGFVQKPTIADGLSRYQFFGVPEQAILDTFLDLPIVGSQSKRPGSEPLR